MDAYNKGSANTTSYESLNLKGTQTTGSTNMEPAGVYRPVAKSTAPFFSENHVGVVDLRDGNLSITLEQRVK